MSIREKERIKQEIVNSYITNERVGIYCRVVNFKFIITNNFKNKITDKVSNKKAYI